MHVMPSLYVPLVVLCFCFFKKSFNSVFVFNAQELLSSIEMSSMSFTESTVTIACNIISFVFLFGQNWDDQAHLTFMQTHLAELLELLADPAELSGLGQALRGSKLSPEALQALSVLLEGTVSHGRTIHPLHRLLSRAPLQSMAGYSKLSRSYSLQQLQSWLCKVLILNPFGMSTCLRSGKKLAWALQGAKCPFLL